MLLGHSLVGHEDHVITCVATPHPSFLYLWCPPPHACCVVVAATVVMGLSKCGQWQEEMHASNWSSTRSP